MENLGNELIQIHQEDILHEAVLKQTLRQPGKRNAAIFWRALSGLGEALIRIGTRLKERSNPRLTADEASVPSFLIML